MTAVTRPRLEGSVAVRDGRRLGFAEYGVARGPAVLWMHGTPGARRQVPLEARAIAEAEGLRIIGIDRPGIGSSTAHLYRDVLDWTGDLELLADTLGLDTFATVGLSGGGPYALAAAAAFPDRVPAVGVLGGVAPTVGVDAAAGGPIQLAVTLEPVLRHGRLAMGAAISGVIRVVKPLANHAVDLYGHFQPPGDRTLLAVPEFKAMFVDDLLNGSRFQMSAPFADLVLFCRHWGFDLADVRAPVHWWHGDDDHIVPLRHGEHAVARLPDARLSVIAGQSHLGGLGIAREVLDGVLEGVLGGRGGPAGAAVGEAVTEVADAVAGRSDRRAGGSGRRVVG